MAPFSWSRISVLLLIVCSAGQIADASSSHGNGGRPLVRNRENRNLKHHSGGGKEDKSAKASKPSSPSTPSKPSHSKPSSPSKPSSGGGKSGKASATPAPSVISIMEDMSMPTADDLMSLGGSSSPTSSSTDAAVIMKGSKSSKEDVVSASHSSGSKSSKTPSGSSSSNSGSKSGKATAVPEFDLNMSMMSVDTTTMSPTVASKANKPLTEFFIKAPLGTITPSSKSGKLTGGADSTNGKSGKVNSSGTGGKSGKDDGSSTSSTSGSASSSGKASKVPTTSTTSTTPASSPASSTMPTAVTADGVDADTSSPTMPPVDADTSSPTQEAMPSTQETSAPTGEIITRVAPAPVASPTPAGQIAMGGKPSKEKVKDNLKSNPSPTPTTYEPTAGPDDEDSNSATENFVAMEPFALKLFASVPAPRYDEDVVKEVTMKHLTHSFRTQNFVLERMNLMVLEKEGTNARRSLATRNIYELIFGGVLYFDDKSPTPTVDEMNAIVRESFEGDRADYYIDLLQEKGIDVGKVVLDEDIVQPGARSGAPGASSAESGSGDSSAWKTLTVSLCGAVGGIGLLAVGARLYFKKRKAALMSDDMDGMEKGQYIVRLKDEDEIENFPGTNTIAMTDDRSVPSTIGHHEEDDASMSSSSRSTSLDEIEQYDPRISPLEDPGENIPTRYVSVFTVKKDVGGKSLEETDLRALAIAYLSKMLKKFPNTYLLPYDKTSDLQPITNIRNIPDELSELENYVGNARTDESTGKVMFNLRVESDTPVSKMKTNKGSSSKGLAPLPAPKRALSDVAENESKGAEKGKEPASEENEEGKGLEDVSL